MSCESFTDIDSSFADETIGAASPEEFINWIRGAEYVFTDSFHGIAFSVINHKQFYVFYRVRRDAKQSRNSRIDNILDLWQCGGRLITDTELEWGDDTESVIDYNKVDPIVSDNRRASLQFLKNALKAHFESGKLTCAICAAPSVLGHLGILNGKHYTSFPAFASDSYGGIYETELAVEDGNVITGRGMGATIEFARLIIRRLTDDETMRRLEYGMQYEHSFRTLQKPE